MKIFTYLVALLFGLQAFAQDQQGYYIDNSGTRVDGYFKTTDFYDSSSLEFKTPNGEFSKLDTRGVKEYGIDGQFKFRRYDIKVDKSTTNVKKLSYGKDPLWESETVFLNVILEGKASLYSAKFESVKYFYTLAEDETPQQLLYRKYKLSDSQIGENIYFKQQLLNTVNCGNKPTDHFAKIEYSKGDLVKVFRDHNTCLGSESIEYSNSTSKGFKTLFVAFVGASTTSFGVKSDLYESDKASSIGYSVGAEVVFRTPSEKWDFFFRGELEKLSSEVTVGLKNSTNTTLSRFELDAISANAYMGPRYNLIINDSNKIFFDGAAGFSFPFGTLEQFVFSPGGSDDNPQELELKAAFAVNFGVGYAFNDKYGICFRYETSRDMTGINVQNTRTDISRIGVTLRYTF